MASEWALSVTSLDCFLNDVTHACLQIARMSYIILKYSARSRQNNYNVKARSFINLKDRTRELLYQCKRSGIVVIVLSSEILIFTTFPIRFATP